MTESLKCKGYAGDIPIYCAHDRILQVDEIRPNPQNPNLHPKAQVDLLAKVIAAQGWRAPITISTFSGLIVRGHGRYEAAKILNCPVPVDYQHYENQESELADLVADNRLAELSDLDNQQLCELFSDLDVETLDIGLTGYTELEIQDLLAGLNADELDIDNVNSKDVVYDHKLSIDRTDIILTDEEYEMLMEQLKKYTDENGVTFGFARWLLNGN